MEHQFRGLHIISELYGINEEKFNDTEKIEEVLRAGIVLSGATLLKIDTFHFTPEGFTIFAILEESHVALHAYPEHGAIFSDAFTCGNCSPSSIIDSIYEYFEPTRGKTKKIHRGLRAL